MRVLHILDHSIPLHSGYTFRTLAILKHQRALGWETFHLTGPKQGSTASEQEEVAGWSFYRTPIRPNLLDRLPAAAPIGVISQITRRLEALIEQVKPDILHAHSPVLNAIPALRVGRRHGIPVVYEVRACWEDAAVDHGTATAGGLRYRLSRSLETWALKRVDAITTICDGLRQDIVARGIPSEKVTVIPNAVDTEQFVCGGTPDSTLRRQLGWEGAVILGFVGSFYAYEGLGVLLRAMPQLLAAGAPVRLLLVGGGWQQPELEQLAHDLGISQHVVFTGRIPHAEVPRYYDTIDVLVYPRLSMRLTELVTPLKPLEAMASGRLVVASDVGGHRELIQSGETGTLFKAGDSGALANAVLDLLAHPERWPAQKTRARSFVENERNWRVSVARYRPIYDALAAPSGA
jgi:PEP-CTERM/exosortase A-associated glycosyltransferase